MGAGEKLKYLRKKRKLSVDDLAEMVGKSRATIYRYENGDIEDMPYTVLVPFANALGVSPSYFFDTTENTRIEITLTNSAFQVHLNKWIDFEEATKITDEEFNDIIDYAKYIVSKRK